MRRPNIIEKDASQITTVQDLTWVFESIASNQVAKVKHKVDLSKQFFRLIWKQYSSIRFDPKTRVTNRQLGNGKKEKVFVVITGEARLSGDIDQRLVTAMLKDYDKKTTDIIVLGSHGASQLSEHNVSYVKFFKVPETENYIDVSPIIEAILDYSQTIVYYEEYVSLGLQGIKSIDLITSMRSMSEDAEEDVMTKQNTIFEPSLNEIADQMEITMMTLALSQTILESSLSQAASRFNAMALAKKRAGELLSDYQLEFHRSKRYESDRRLREVIISLKEKRKHAGVDR